MSRSRLTFLISIVVLVVVSYFAWDIYNEKSQKGTLSSEPLTDFAIEDTGSVDKIEILDATKGLEAVLERSGKYDWMVNGKYCARKDAINLLLKTFKRIQVQKRVPENAVENIIKSLATRKKVVRIYEDGELKKKWIVGNPTRDHYGTYMNLEKNVSGEWLISKEPMVMELPGFNGHLWSRFFAEEEQWRCTEIFENKPENIASISTTFPAAPEESYELTLKNGNQFSLLDGNGSNVGAFDTTLARNLFIGFRRVNFEFFNKILTEEGIDSLKQVTPYFVMNVTDKDGNSTSLKAWRIKVEDQVSPDGIPLEYDPDRMYALTDKGDVVVIQFFVFDRLIRHLSEFKGRSPVDKTSAL